MAIRPVDLQLAYMAAPASAAVLSTAQEGPQTAQQAAQSAFAAEVVRREESVDEPVKVEGSKVRSRGDGEREHQDPPARRRHKPGSDENSAEAGAAGPLGLSGDGEHFIDVTA